MPLKVLQDPRKKKIFLIILAIALISAFAIVISIIVVNTLTDGPS